MFVDTRAPFFWFRMVEFGLLFVDALASSVVPVSMPLVQVLIPASVILAYVVVVCVCKPMHGKIDNIHSVCISVASLVVLGVSTATREVFGLDPVQVFWLSLVSIAVSGVLLSGSIAVSVFLAVESTRVKNRLEKLAIQVEDFEKTCTLEQETRKVPELIQKPFVDASGPSQPCPGPRGEKNEINRD